MALQHIYTSAERGLDPGSNGYCTVACHPQIQGELRRKLESCSRYAPAENGRLRAQGAQWPDVFAYRKLTLGERHCVYVLSHITHAPSDHTGRSNYLAQHLVCSKEEIETAVCSPAAIMLQFDWLQQWEGRGRLLSADDEASLTNFTRHPLPGSQWEKLTGDSGGAATPFAPSQQEASIEWQWGDAQNSISVLTLMAESLELLCVTQGISAAWDITFTTFLQPRDTAREFRWWGCPQLPSAMPEERSLAGTVIDLRHPSRPAADTDPKLLDAARRGYALPNIATIPASTPTLVIPANTNFSTHEVSDWRSKPGERRLLGRLAFLLAMILLLAGLGWWILGKQPQEAELTIIETQPLPMPTEEVVPSLPTPAASLAAAPTATIVSKPATTVQPAEAPEPEFDRPSDVEAPKEPASAILITDTPAPVSMEDHQSLTLCMPEDNSGNSFAWSAALDNALTQSAHSLTLITLDKPTPPQMLRVTDKGLTYLQDELALEIMSTKIRLKPAFSKNYPQGVGLRLSDSQCAILRSTNAPPLKQWSLNVLTPHASSTENKITVTPTSEVSTFVGALWATDPAAELVLALHWNEFNFLATAKPLQSGFEGPHEFAPFAELGLDEDHKVYRRELNRIQHAEQQLLKALEHNDDPQSKPLEKNPLMWEAYRADTPVKSLRPAMFDWATKNLDQLNADTAIQDNPLGLLEDLLTLSKEVGASETVSQERLTLEADSLKERIEKSELKAHITVLLEIHTFLRSIPGEAAFPKSKSFAKFLTDEQAYKENALIFNAVKNHQVTITLNLQYSNGLSTVLARFEN